MCTRPPAGPMHWLETRIPPPVVMLLLAAMMWGLPHYLPEGHVDLPLHGVIGAVTAFCGLIFNLLPKYAFARAGTTVNPMTPDRSRQLVTSGLHRYSRNPMYVGQALLLASLA